MIFLDLAQQAAAVAAGHAIVGDQHADAQVLVLQHGDRFVGPGCREDFVVRAHHPREILASQILVVDVQDCCGQITQLVHCAFHSTLCKSKIILVHSPTTLSACSMPPCCST